MHPRKLLVGVLLAFGILQSVPALADDPPIGYIEVRDESTALRRRRRVNFTGAGVSAADDSVNAETDVTIGGSGSGITIGTTAITSGTDTRVLFNDGGFVGEDAGLTYVKGTDALTVVGALASATLNTGQGANELYAMDQNVRTTDSPTLNAATLTSTNTISNVFTVTADSLTTGDAIEITSNSAAATKSVRTWWPTSTTWGACSVSSPAPAW